MRKILIIVALTVVMCLLCFAGCLGNKPYDSIASKTDTVLDDSVALISSENMSQLLDNPDRGLRMETYITLGDPLYSYPLNTEDPFERVKRLIEKYEEDKPTLSQVYVYLTNYNDKPLDELALKQMYDYFSLFKENNIRMLLRFAYQTENVPDTTYSVMKNHLKTIDKFFTDNAQLIKDTVYCLQMGMIGAWGEGHSFINFDWKEHSNDMVKDMCEFADKHNLYLQVRTMEIYSKVPLKYKSIVGLHDDYIIDKNDLWAFLPESDWRYDYMMKKFSKTVNDGEMPWGDAKYADSEDGELLNSMDGKAILKRVAQNTMTSFSLEHNYREKDGKEFSMYKWKSQYLTYDECKSIGITVNKRLFDINDGKLSIYDVMRYHLGYQLALSNYRLDGDKLSFTISNYGFAAPLKERYLALVTMENGELKEHKIDAYKPEKLQSGVTMKYTVRVPEGTEIVGVKLAISADSPYTVRFANDTLYDKGIQYFA